MYLSINQRSQSLIYAVMRSAIKVDCFEMKCRFSYGSTFAYEMLLHQHFFQASALIVGIGIVLCQQVNGFIGRDISDHRMQQNSIQKLVQLCRSNNIRSAYLLFNGNGIDASQQFLQSIAKMEHPASTFQWRIFKLQTNLASLGTLPSFSETRLKIANSLHEWVFIFAEHLEFGREEFELCMASDIRDYHHLSLVLVLMISTQQLPTNEQSIIDHLQYVWTHVHPTDLLAIVCCHSDCISYRYNPDMITQNASTSEETQLLFEPANHAAAMRLQRPLDVDPDCFIAKFALHSINMFVAIDLARDGREILVGYNLWIAHLLAEMLHKPLHVVLIGMEGLYTHINNWKTARPFETDMRVPTKSLQPEDRFLLTTTYAKTLEDFNR